MDVYLIEINNCESYEDYYYWIDKVFTTYKAASMELIERDYKVYPERDFSSGEWDVRFKWQESDEYMARCNGAKIIEKVLYE